LLLIDVGIVAIVDQVHADLSEYDSGSRRASSWVDECLSATVYI